MLPSYGPRFGVPGLDVALSEHHSRRPRSYGRSHLATEASTRARRRFPAPDGFERILALSEVVRHLDFRGKGWLTRLAGHPHRYVTV